MDGIWKDKVYWEYCKFQIILHNLILNIYFEYILLSYPLCETAVNWQLEISACYCEVVFPSLSLPPPSFCVYLCCSPAHPCVRVLISALLSLSLLPAGSHSVAQGWLFFLQFPGIINVCYHIKLVNGLHVNRATRQRVLNFSTSLAVMI